MEIETKAVIVGSILFTIFVLLFLTAVAWQ